MQKLIGFYKHCGFSVWDSKSDKELWLKAPFSPITIWSKDKRFDLGWRMVAASNTHVSGTRLMIGFVFPFYCCLAFIFEHKSISCQNPFPIINLTDINTFWGVKSFPLNNVSCMYSKELGSSLKFIAESWIEVDYMMHNVIDWLEAIEFFFKSHVQNYGFIIFRWYFHIQLY